MSLALLILGIVIIVMSLLLLLVTPFALIFTLIGVLSIIASRRAKKQKELDAARAAEHREYVQNHTESFDIAGLYYYKDAVKKLLDENGEYIGPCLLVPDPDNQHDPNAIKIVVDDVLVGYVPAEECSSVRKLLNNLIDAEATIDIDEDDINGYVTLEYR